MDRKTPKAVKSDRNKQFCKVIKILKFPQYVEAN